MSTSAQFDQLGFGDGTNLTLPIMRAVVGANNLEASTKNAQQILPLMPMELAHIKMGHRLIRSLMARSLHQVWSDYKLAPKIDNICEGCKLPQADLLPGNTLALQLQIYLLNSCMVISSTFQSNKD
eukprot:3412369-Ditylum_brightwellii.AAC.1